MPPRLRRGAELDVAPGGTRSQLDRGDWRPLYAPRPECAVAVRRDLGWGRLGHRVRYTRTEDSRSPDLAFLFEGIEGSVIGDFGHMLGGAAGDELDAADFTAGTPANARILMSSRHNETYYPFLETVTQVEPNVSGPHNPKVRSDVVYIDTGAGGRVFSAGSICWAGAMAFNDYDNNVSRLCANVLKSSLAD